VANYLAEARCRFDTGTNPSRDGVGSPPKADGDKASTDLLKTQQIDKTRFRRSVGRFDGSDEATGLNKPDGSLRQIRSLGF
jgi:hypothetical protein